MVLFKSFGFVSVVNMALEALFQFVALLFFKALSKAILCASTSRFSPITQVEKGRILLKSQELVFEK